MPATLSPSLEVPPGAELRPVAALFQSLTGKRPSPASIWRWCQKGTGRAGKLPALRLIGQWHTTHEALVAWLRAGSETPEAAPTTPIRSEATRRKLAAAGLIEEGR